MDSLSPQLARPNKWNWFTISLLRTR